MRRQALELTLIGMGAVMAVIAAARWQQSTPLGTATPPRMVSSAPERPVAESLLAEAEELAVANDPFRLSNAPPEVPFDPHEEAVVGGRVVAAVSVRPSFSLKGIMGGPPWQAVVDGLPGQPPGVVVREGERFDKLVVRSVTRDSVIIQGPDTGWILRFGSRP